MPLLLTEGKDMVEIKWQDPPAALTFHESVVAALKKNPGRWALVVEDRSTSSAGTWWKKFGCETKVHRKNPGEAKPKYDVYARWPEQVLPLPMSSRAKPAKDAVAIAVANGTALTPPPPPLPRKGNPVPAPANDMGLGKFLADRRSRGAVDRPE
jgi:hypothetical protein